MLAIRGQPCLEVWKQLPSTREAESYPASDKNQE